MLRPLPLTAGQVQVMSRPLAVADTFGVVGVPYGLIWLDRLLGSPDPTEFTARTRNR
jgi:hypothetical protein